MLRKIALVALLFLSACPGDTSIAPVPSPPTQTASSPTPEVGRQFVFGVLGEPATLDPRSPLASDLTRALDRLRGPFRVAAREPGLEIVYERDPSFDGPRPRMRRLVVRFVQTTELLIELLDRGELDAAAIPATVNLTDRLGERDIEHVSALGPEVVYLDLRGASDRNVRGMLAATAKVRELTAAYVRDLGRPAETLHPDPGAKGADGRLASVRPTTDATGTVQMAGPVGDELLALMQRALHDDWEQDGFTVDVVTIDARTFYGSWAEKPQVEVAIRRGAGEGLPTDARAFRTLEAVPLFQMETVVAFGADVRGISSVSGGDELFADAGAWWIPR